MTTQAPLYIVYDDREFTNDENRSFVGHRRYSEIIFQRRKLKEYFQESIQPFSNENLFHIGRNADLTALRHKIEEAEQPPALFIVASRAGIAANDNFRQLIARLPYAECSFSDRTFKPLLVFLKNGHELIGHWDQFSKMPLHLWEHPPANLEKLSSVDTLDLGKSRDFLSFMSGSTEARHFNQVEIDAFYYTKRSSDKKKMEAEYRFYDLVPESMRPWLIQPFDFQSDAKSASYKMLRYYLADAALQWVHDAFSPTSFAEFIDRLLFFIAERPRKNANKSELQACVNDLFIGKVDSRAQHLLELQEGTKINQLVSVADPQFELNTQIARYKKLLKKFEKDFLPGYLAAGHGDPCFSNLLYDQQRYILKAIDPKGALAEDDVWTHPFYDLCKVSHSVMGNYDFINNGLFHVAMTADNSLELHIHSSDRSAMQAVFLDRLQRQGYDWRAIRLGEASLFLSMLPLHIDHPNKVMAFVLTAKHILDEVENG